MGEMTKAEKDEPKMDLGKAGAGVIDAIYFDAKVGDEKGDAEETVAKVGNEKDNVEVAWAKTGGEKCEGEEASTRDDETVSENGDGG